MAEGDGGEGGAGGGGGGGEGAGTGFSQADLDAAVAKAVDTATTGLKSKNDELLTKVSDSKAALKAWEGLDPEAVRGVLSKFENDEELKLISEGKHSEAWDRRLEKVNATHQSQIDQVTTSNTTLSTQLEASQSQVRDLLVNQQAISSFISEKGLDTATADVVLRAKGAFVIEEGVPIARDAKGEIIRGKEGPITIAEWVTSLKETAPHLFPGSQGAGTGGSTGGQGGTGDLDTRMAAAASSGDMKTYRKLRDQKKKAAADA